MTLEGAKPRAKAKPAPLALPAPLPAPVLPAIGAGYTLVMTGIGGTGVVTVNQILSTAAVIDGLGVRALDITGFSQKAGPVVSELQLFRDARDRANTLSAGSADLYLVFDLLVGVTSANLAKASPARTTAIVSTSRVPTGRMVADVATHYPDTTLLRRRIDEATRAGANAYLDAGCIAAELIGDHMAANMVVIGAAYQAGRLPLSLAAIRRAIELNGVALDMNLAAFEAGRLAVADPDRLAALLAPPVPRAAPPLAADFQAIVDEVGADGELRRLVEIRVAELAAYQDAAYARAYAAFVGRVRAIEARAVPGRDDLARAVAHHLHKLMAYKDEYEVARLLLLDASGAERERMFGASGRIYWHLHPSFLRGLGVRRKLKLGPWFKPVLTALRWSKRLRGTPLDLLGLDALRRTERALIAEYREAIEAVTARLTPENHAEAVALARLPDVVRGYEHVKRATIASYREQAAAALAAFGADSGPSERRAA